MPSVTADNPSLVDFMKRNSLLVEVKYCSERSDSVHPLIQAFYSNLFQAVPESPSLIFSLIKMCRMFAERFDGAVFVWAVTASVVFARFCKGFVI